MNRNIMIKNEEKINFDYSKVDSETEEVMKKAIEKIGLVTKNTKFVMGEQFSIVQKKLSGNNQYDGFFQKWFEALGLKKDLVYDCINYYKLLVANPDNQMLQELAFSKVCELAKLKENEQKQKEIIEKVSLKEMKVKQIQKLIHYIKSGKELTDELIKEVIQDDSGKKSNLSNFVKATEKLINDFEEQGQDISIEEIEKVLRLIEKVKNVCPILEEKE